MSCETERPGFSGAKSGPVPLTVGQALVVDLVMKLAGPTETVSVSAEGDTAPALGMVIDETPVRACRSTGATIATLRCSRRPRGRSTGTRGTFRVAGQPGDYLALNVDGADFTNNFFGEFFGSIETTELHDSARGRAGIRGQRRRARRAVGALQRRPRQRRHEIRKQPAARFARLFPAAPRADRGRRVRKPARRSGAAHRAAAASAGRSWRTARSISWPRTSSVRRRRSR